MKFKTLKSYLNFRSRCPFCKKSLYNKAETFLRGDGITVKSKTTLDNIIKFDLSEKCNDYLLTHDNYPTSYLTFNVTLFDQSKLGYRLKSVFDPEKEFPKGRFIDLFNRSHIHIISFCKNCSVDYFTTSLPLRCNENGVTEYVLYTETITYKKFLVQNNFIDNKLQIYMKDSAAPPIETDLYNLTLDNSEKFITRIKVVSTFS